MVGNERRAWFGPKRIGFGIRPQTWQGWTVVLTLVAVIVVASVLLGR
ncbi:MAG: hypothetical protein WCA46_11945 [Actinocatenispora sp.]